MGLSVAVPHLTRRARHWHFRRRVPKDLKPFLDVAELTVTLGTEDTHTAVLRCAEVTAYTSTMFGSIREMATKRGLTMDEVQAHARRYHAKMLEVFRQEGAVLVKPFLSRDEQLIEADSVLSVDPVWDAWAERDGRDPLEVRSMKRSGLLDEIQKETGLDTAEIQENSLEALGKLFIEARARARNEVASERLGERYPALSVDTPARPEQAKATPPLSEIANIEYEKGDGQRKYKSEVKSAVDTLIEWYGDQPVNWYTYERMEAYRDEVLRNLPSNRQKLPRYRGRDLKDILQAGVPEDDRIAPSTVNTKHLDRLNVVFARAVRYDYIARSPVAKLRVATDTRPSEERDPFTHDQLQAVVDKLADLRELDLLDAPWKLWGPLIAMYSGARLNEICQLRPADLVCLDGVWCFRHGDGTQSGDKTKNDRTKKLKNPASRRDNPIHPVLIDLGILRVRSQAKSPGWRNQRLLNHLTYVESEGWGRKLGRWFNGGLLSEALPEKGKLAFHSFRHTFSHTLKNAGADMAVLSELEGHAVEGESSVANRYRGGFTPQVQLRELSKLDYGLDFSRLRQTIALEWPE